MNNSIKNIFFWLVRETAHTKWTEAPVLNSFYKSVLSGRKKISKRKKHSMAARDGDSQIWAHLLYNKFHKIEMKNL